MSSSKRPKYVPTGRRRKHNERFHGAFNGGYSAGYFNTVGSNKGWKPRQQNSKQDEVEGNAFINSNCLDKKLESRKRSMRPHQQKLEDFMDEEDHDQWGGPRGLKNLYKDIADNDDDDDEDTSATNYIDVLKFNVEPRMNIGNKLLRVLGWREGNSTAYVPNSGGLLDNSNNQDNRDLAGETEARIVLSEKRLRKVKITQRAVEIPSPKVDTCGLGFEPYKDAPEFKAHLEKRKKLAQQRTILGQHTREVYRVADALGIEGVNKNKNGSGSDLYASHETVEDFIGSKSVGGFALGDEDDDAYDKALSFSRSSCGKLRIDKAEYTNEIYVHSSDEEEENHQQNCHSPAIVKGGGADISSNSATADLAGVLSSFAGIGSSAVHGASTNQLSSGGGGLPGFVLGGAFTSHSVPKRYKGPDIPLTYDSKGHEFDPDEIPPNIRALSRAVQLEVADEKRQKALGEALRANASSNNPSQFRGRAIKNAATAGQPPPRSNAPMAGGAFSGLAAAMRNRFTSVRERGSDEKKTESGLRSPTKEKHLSVKSRNPSTSTSTSNNNDEEKKQDQLSKEIRIRRTMHPFAPHRLLCKRFHVPVPVGVSHIMAHATGAGRITEATYFQQEILNTAAVAGGGRDKMRSHQVTSKKSEETKKKVAGVANLFSEDGTVKDNAVAGSSDPAQQRPSKSILKSIFDSNNSDEGEDSGLEESQKAIANSGQSWSQPDDKCTRTLDKAELHISDTCTGNENVATEETPETSQTVIKYNGRGKEEKEREREKNGNRHRPESEDEEDNASRGRCQRCQKKKRSRSMSSVTSDLSRDSTSTDHRKERKRHRDRKDKRKKHKSKKKKKSKKTLMCGR